MKCITIGCGYHRIMGLLLQLCSIKSCYVTAAAAAVATSLGAELNSAS